MNVQRLNSIPKSQLTKILNRSTESFGDVSEKVRAIINDVRQNGDAALLEYTKQFDNVTLESLVVSGQEIEEAYKNVSTSYLNAIKQMKKNIRAFSQSQITEQRSRPVETEKGISVWHEWRPIERVGLYVPGGKAVYLSTVLMTAIPATVAGCKEILMVSPPQKNGTIVPEVLVAAAEAGVTTIFKVGGAQAIAALAYGTESVPAVAKIFGPGNTFVTTAKQLVMNDVAIDMPAGPSEVMILADETANPSFIAADLMADAEHSGDNGCVLLTTSQEVAEQTVQKIEELIVDLPTREMIEQSMREYGLIAVVESIDEAVSFANNYAPEHLHIMTKDPRETAKKISHAGSLFLGDWTSKSSGDYATGANHVLPTGGLAKSYSALKVNDFGRWIELQECTKDGLKAIRETVELISEIEGLPAHALSTRIRFEDSLY